MLKRVGGKVRRPILLLQQQSRSYSVESAPPSPAPPPQRISTSILKTIKQPSSSISSWPKLRENVAAEQVRLVVLDDDPTGCESIYDVNILLDYSVQSIVKQMKRDDKIFYILTNTRYMDKLEASETIKNITKNLNEASQLINYTYPLQLISRSDAYLRGHFPVEVEAIKSNMGLPYDGTIFCPARFDGATCTFEDVHYVIKGEDMIPVTTNYANLYDWVIDRYNGKIGMDKIVSITIKDIREGGPEVISDKLELMQHDSFVIVNAVHQHDLNTFILGLQLAESNGYRFIYQTAVSFVASRAAIEPKPNDLPYGLGLGSNSAHTAGRTYGGLVVLTSNTRIATGAHLIIYLIIPSQTHTCYIFINFLSQTTFYMSHTLFIQGYKFTFILIFLLVSSLIPQINPSNKTIQLHIHTDEMIMSVLANRQIDRVEISVPSLLHNEEALFGKSLLGIGYTPIGDKIVDFSESIVEDAVSRVEQSLRLGHHCLLYPSLSIVVEGIDSIYGIDGIDGIKGTEVGQQIERMERIERIEMIERIERIERIEKGGQEEKDDSIESITAAEVKVVSAAITEVVRRLRDVTPSFIVCSADSHSTSPSPSSSSTLYNSADHSSPCVHTSLSAAPVATVASQALGMRVARGLGQIDPGKGV